MEEKLRPHQSFDKAATGQKIKEIRKRKGMKSLELADKLFMSPSLLSRFESGEGCGNIEKLILAANALEIDVRVLIDAGLTE